MDTKEVNINELSEKNLELMKECKELLEKINKTYKALNTDKKIKNKEE